MLFRSNKYNKLSKNGNVVRTYVYKVVSATADELADYQATQNVNYREDEDGSPLFYTINFEGNVVDIVKGKTKDQVTGVLTDVYRALSSEDFELKRSILTAPSPVMSIKSAVTVTKTAEPIDVDNIDY